MLRVRVVSPASLTGPLVERLTAAHGVQNLVELREAVRRPQGDAVHFDLSEGALLLGFFVAIVLTLLFGLAVKASGDTPAQVLQGVRPVSDLINTPNMFSVIVAILAGLVGVISLTESRANALIGVFISVTTIPAAADVGVSVAYGSWSEAWGSLAQLLLNVVLLIVVGAGGLSTQRIIWRRLRPGAGQPPG
jgi:uncharacterized membrane protein